LSDPIPNLFVPFDPYSKSAVLFIRLFEDDSSTAITIRPVWIIGDLILINEWLASPLNKSNWLPNRTGMGVLQHYKNFLLSRQTQSLMLEQNQVAIAQIDLLPCILAGYPADLHFKENDYALNFLYKESFRYPMVFKFCLQCLIEFFFSFRDTRDLYIKLLRKDIQLQEILPEIGFEALDRKNLHGRSVYIYRIQRPVIPRHF
jgi:hypothetical protein